MRIAARAAYLLQVGGRMIYSTCTFNPVENEAVVAEVPPSLPLSLSLPSPHIPPL